MRRLAWLVLAAALPLAGCADELEEQLKKDFRHSKYFTPVSQTISLNQPLTEALGTPITFGDLDLKAYDKGKHTATVDVQLSGPKGKGHAVVQIAQSEKDGVVQSRGGDFFPSSGPPIHLPPR